MAESSSQGVSRDEFNELKQQISELTALCKGQCKFNGGDNNDTSGNQNKTGSNDIPIFQFGAKDSQNKGNEKKVVDLSGGDESIEFKRKFQKLEDDVRSIRGVGSFGSVKYPDLCIFPGARFPDKFQIPEFEKYNGVGDPYTHLKIYIGELGSYAEDEGLRMQLFQKSLTGEARTWYARLDNNKIHNWEDLAQAFLAQYSFQSLMAPDRYQITKVKKLVNESFRDYAQRWRRMAAQVNPPMSESEMVMTFIDIQEAPYYERVLSGIGKPFSEMVKHGEMVEMGLKAGKIRDYTALEVVAEQLQSGNYSNASGGSKTKEDEEVSVVLQGLPRKNNISLFNLVPKSNPPRQQPTFDQNPGQRKTVRNREFTPLNDSLENVLAFLVAQKKIIELAPPADPKGKLYDPSKRCAYHSGAPGHDTQECWTLKHRIQNMIDSGEIIVEQQGNVTINN